MSQLEDTNSYLKLTVPHCDPPSNIATNSLKVITWGISKDKYRRLDQNVLIHGIGMLVLPVSVTVEMIWLGNAESLMVASLSCLRRVSV